MNLKGLREMVIQRCRFVIVKYVYMWHRFTKNLVGLLWMQKLSSGMGRYLDSISC